MDYMIKNNGKVYIRVVNGKVETCTENMKSVSTNIIYDDELFFKKKEEDRKRSEIISNVDIIVDGEYIDEQKDLTLKWRGSKNQHVIDVKQSLAQNKMVLYCD